MDKNEDEDIAFLRVISGLYYSLRLAAFWLVFFLIVFLVLGE